MNASKTAPTTEQLALLASLPRRTMARRATREEVAAARLTALEGLPESLRHYWEGSASASVDADVADGLTVDI